MIPLSLRAGKEKQTVLGLIDSGAGTCVYPLHLFKKDFPRSRITPTRVRLKGFLGESIPVVGETEFEVSLIPEGVSPWALLRRTGRRKCPNFSKFSLLFFFRIWALLGPRKTRKKKFFESDNISDFRLSDFQTFRLSDFRLSVKQNSKTIKNFNIRPGEEKFCSDWAECPRNRCRPPPMPPLPPSPQKRVFLPPNFNF